jgi:hypothetical protein
LRISGRAAIGAASADANIISYGLYSSSDWQVGASEGSARAM